MKLKTYRALNIFNVFFIVMGLILFSLATAAILSKNSIVVGIFILYFSFSCFWEAFVPKIILYQDKMTIYSLKNRGFKDPRLHKLIKREIYFADIRHFRVNKGMFYRSIEISVIRNGRHVISMMTFSPYMMKSFLSIMSKKLKKISDNSIEYNYNSFHDFLKSTLFFSLFAIVTAIPIITIYYLNKIHQFFSFNQFQYFYLIIFFIAGILLFIGLYALHYKRYKISNDLIRSKQSEPDLKIKKLFKISIVFYFFSLLLLFFDIIS